jgi:polyvinyl alcohol dehydrogenase (cytochrome)
MNLSAILFVGLLCAPSLAQTPPAPPPGEALFKGRCVLCHMDLDDSAPSAAHLRTLGAEAILDKLDTGSMQPMAAGLSEQQKKDIADYLTAKAPPAPADAKPQ